MSYNEETSTYRFQCSESESIGMEILTTLARVSGRSPLEMEPIGAIVDTRIVDKLFCKGWQPDETVTFDYLNYQISVDQFRTVTVRQRPPVGR